MKWTCACETNVLNRGKWIVQLVKQKQQWQQQWRCHQTFSSYTVPLCLTDMLKSTRVWNAFNDMKSKVFHLCYKIANNALKPIVKKRNTTSKTYSNVERTWAMNCVIVLFFFGHMKTTAHYGNVSMSFHHYLVVGTHQYPNNNDSFHMEITQTVRTKIKHVCFCTVNIERSMDFYCTNSKTKTDGWTILFINIFWIEGFFYSVQNGLQAFNEEPKTESLLALNKNFQNKHTLSQQKN